MSETRSLSAVISLQRLIIGKKERKLKKGNGFHLDIVLVCLTNVGCGMLGAPWMCAATVRSVTHVSAVTAMSRTHAPGEKPHIIQVKGLYDSFIVHYYLVQRRVETLRVNVYLRNNFLQSNESVLFWYRR